MAPAEYNDDMNPNETSSSVKEAAGRRSFLASLVAAVVGGVLVLFPFAAGAGVLFHPLRRRRRSTGGDDAGDTADYVRVCSLDSLPADGVPHEHVVIADVADAWTRIAGQRIGSVYLVRTEADDKPHVTALSATCPHLGCAVEFDANDDRFECPCHASAFSKGGKKLFGPSLRGLDPLEVKLVDDKGTQEIWVDFQRFRAGIAERIPVA
jgi:menaquinol-cytochrome c reductase iron-sulfur subunit